MARPEITGRKTKSKTLPPLLDPEDEKLNVVTERERRAAERARKHTDRAIKRTGFSIDEFCFKNGFSRATYYNLKTDGQAPDELRVRGKIIITNESERRWLKRMAALSV